MTTASRRRRATLPDFIAPCLATLADAPPTDPLWVHEIKFDGYRLQARVDGANVRLLTRSGLDWTDKFRPLADALAALRLRSAIIDGEVVVEDEQGRSNFGDLVADLKAKRSDRMTYYAFDLMFLDGKDLRRDALLTRKTKLRALLPHTPRTTGGPLRYSDHIDGSGTAMLTEVCKLGLEGIISKRADLGYRSGRGLAWLKSKCSASDAFVIVGYLNSNAVANAVGALVLGYYDGKSLIYAGRVGTGFDRRVAHDLWQRLQKLHSETSAMAIAVSAVQAGGVVWVKPRLVAQVTYRAWTADGLLRHASFTALRSDKPARQVSKPK